MNQILNVKNSKNKLKLIFKLQFFCSVIFVIATLIYFFIQTKSIDKNRLTDCLNKNAELVKVFNKKSSMYLGRIIISKINLEYTVFNEYSNEKLRILPCKFFGDNLEKKGNICIIAHNYFDDRFFGKINKLNKNDEIVMEDLNGNKYKYSVYKIYEIDENDINELKNSNEYNKILTLCTCTFSKNKRFVVKARNVDES